MTIKKEYLRDRSPHKVLQDPADPEWIPNNWCTNTVIRTVIVSSLSEKEMGTT